MNSQVWKLAGVSLAAGLLGGILGAYALTRVSGQPGRYQYVRSGNAGFLVDTASGDVVFRPLPGEGYRMFNLRNGKVGRRETAGDAWDYRDFDEPWKSGDGGGPGRAGQGPVEAGSPGENPEAGAVPAAPEAGDGGAAPE